MTCHELENRTRLPQAKGRALGHPLSAHPSRKRWTIGLASVFVKMMSLRFGPCTPTGTPDTGSARASPMLRAEPSPFGRLTAHHQPCTDGIGIGREPHASFVHGGCRNQDVRPGAGRNHARRVRRQGERTEDKTASLEEQSAAGMTGLAGLGPTRQQAHRRCWLTGRRKLQAMWTNRTTEAAGNANQLDGRSCGYCGRCWSTERQKLRTPWAYRATGAAGAIILLEGRRTDTVSLLSGRCGGVGRE